MTPENLAEKLGVGATALNDWMAQAGLTIEDMQSDVFQKTAVADLKQKAVADLTSGLAVVGGGSIAKTDEAPIASTKTKAKKGGGKLAKKKEETIAVGTQQVQQAQQVQQIVNSTLTNKMQSIAADASVTVDGIQAFTQAVGTRIGQEIVGMPTAIGEIATQYVEEVSPNTGVGFSALDEIAASAIASIG
jgi:hypothetical protein